MFVLHCDEPRFLVEFSDGAPGEPVPLSGASVPADLVAGAVRFYGSQVQGAV